MVIELREEEFENKIKENGKILVDCYAPWCGPCRMLEKTIEDIEPTLDKVKFYEIVIDEVDESFIETYQIQNVPVLLFFNEGLQVEREVGNIPKSKIMELINNNL